MDKDCDKEPDKPMAPPRKKNHSKGKKDGSDSTEKRVRSAFITDFAPENMKDSNSGDENINKKKAPCPPRPPLPVIINKNQDVQESKPQLLKSKPSIPARPASIIKSGSVSNKSPSPKNGNNDVKIECDDETSKTEIRILNSNTDTSIVSDENSPTKPKPKPRPRPRPESIPPKPLKPPKPELPSKPQQSLKPQQPPKPQPRRSFNKEISPSKPSNNSDGEKQLDCESKKATTTVQEKLSIVDNSKLTVNNNLEQKNNNIDTQWDISVISSNRNTENLNESSLKTKDDKQNSLNRGFLEESISDTLHFRSLGRKRHQKPGHMKKSSSDSRINKIGLNFDKIPDKQEFLKLMTDEEPSVYENVKLKTDDNSAIDNSYKDNLFNVPKAIKQQSCKQTGNDHSYVNIGLKDKQNSSNLEESFILLHKFNQHPIFFEPNIYSHPKTGNRNLSNSCDTIYVDPSLIQENIYNVPKNTNLIEDDLYAVPTNNQLDDSYKDFLQSPRLSFTSSDRSSKTSSESARLSTMSSSSHSSASDRSQAYENVDLQNPDQNKDRCINQSKTDVEIKSSPNRKQQRTNSRRDVENDDGTGSYLNMPLPPATPEDVSKGQDTYVEIDFDKKPSFASQKRIGGNVQKPKLLSRLSGDCFLPTTLLNESTRFKKKSGSFYEPETGEYRNYFESSDEEEEEPEKPTSKLFSIANEILTTERSFVNGLQLICEDFGVALKNAVERNSKLLPDGAYQSMFLNIEQICELDKKFLKDLEDRMKQWELHQRIGDLIRGYGHFLKMYTVYIKGYDAAMLMFHDCLTNNMKFQQIVNEFEKSPKAKNMKLSSFFLKPIQRIPSYRLLLIDYLEHLPENHLDYKDIADGLDIVSEVASHINESMKEGERFQHVLRIQSMFNNCKDIVKPGRYVIKEGSLQKLSRKELQQREFILFTDALFYCSCVGSQMKLINEIPLVGMTVQIPDAQDLSNEFHVISTKRSFILNAKSPEEREEWVTAIEGAVKIANEKVGTFIIKKDGTTMLNSELGQIAPPWIPDSRVTMCQICASAFTMYNRRHHCRACGKVVCNDCSCFEAPLRYMEDEVARVCSICYEQLYEQHRNENVPTRRELIYKFKDTKGKKRKNRLKSMPSALTEVAAQEEGIQISGFLRVKKGAKKEKRYWFVLKDFVLYMYKASSDPAATSTTPVLGYQVRKAGNWDEEDFVFTLSHAGIKDTMILRAETKASAERWVQCLNDATEPPKL